MDEAVFHGVRVIVASRTAFGKHPVMPHPSGMARPRDLAISRGMAGFCVALFLLLTAWGAGAAWFILCRDDLVARVLARQAEVQYAYEERLSGLRAQLDRVASRQLINQDSFEDRVERLTSRQAQIETRHAVLASLVQSVGGVASAASSPAARPDAGMAVRGAPALGGPAVPALSSPSAAPLSPQPIPSKPTPSSDGKPMPERPLPATGQPLGEDGGLGLRGSSPAAPEEAATSSARQVIGGRIEQAETSLKGIELAQVRTLERIAGDVGQRVTRMKSALRDTGLDLTRVLPRAAADAMGGPFVPAETGNVSLFDRLAVSVRGSVLLSQELNRAVVKLPLSRPMPTDADITSHFGTRLDPFLRAPAMHTGIDFRANSGAPVRATGAGRVVTAEYSGGYGNMVEIEHAGGVTTRYAHLSSIAVEEGETVSVGQIVGRVGSTGRSTGPHLHYETRIDGDAVDPHRFLRAGTRLARD